MNTTTNKYISDWIADIAGKTKPDKIVWIDGSEAQIEELRNMAVADGSMLRLNEEKLPNCFLHRTDPNDVARVEGRTFICCRKEEDAGPTNHWMDPREMYKKLDGILENSMHGRT
ncbi:MAG: phosphoenolpyruvate carboxykinase, partial [Oscillospiraceae bacterium]